MAGKVLEAQRQKFARDERVLTLDVQMCAGYYKTAENIMISLARHKPPLKMKFRCYFRNNSLNPKVP